MPTDPATFCCIALGRGVFFWQNDRRLCPRAGEMEMSSTEMAKRWASHALVAFFPSQKIKDPKCLQKSQDNHDFLPVTSISSGFKTRDLWWHDSFQALEEVPVCLELCPSMVSRRLWSWGTHCSLHTPNDLEANRPRSFPLFFAWPNLSSAIQIRDCCLYTLYREHQPNMSRFGVSSFILHAFQQSSPPNFNTKAPFSWSCRSR